MTYKILGDSCMDLTEELKQDPHFHMVPLTLQVDHAHIRDDETFDQKRFLELVRRPRIVPKLPARLPRTLKNSLTAKRSAFLLSPCPPI